jgi:hypothetical protein
MPRAGLIMLFLAGEALAHPDHGGSGWVSAALSHLLSEPDHLAMILAPLAIAAWLGWRALRNTNGKRPFVPARLRAGEAPRSRNAAAPSGSADESGSRRAD